MGVRSGDRVVVRNYYRYGPGFAEGPVTTDNDGIWLVRFYNGREDTFDYHLLERTFNR